MYRRKSLGQHFLNSRGALTTIVDTLNPSKDSLVVEIGPGEGALTEYLLARAGRVIALEKDAQLIPLLQEKFSEAQHAGTFELIEGDALEFDPDTLNHNNLHNNPKGLNYLLVGNIPYNITGALFRKFLSAHTQPTTLVFLIQKEVAERIARSPKESILSLSIKAYGTPRYVSKVPAGAFVPPPAVDSAILAVENISRKRFEDRTHEERFFALIRAGFAKKRKLLARNIETVLGPATTNRMTAAGIPERARAEDVPLTQWIELAR